MLKVERGIELGVIEPVVGTAALAALKRRGCDQLDQWVGILGKRFQSGPVTLQAGVTPQRLATFGGQRRGRTGRGR